MDNVLCTMIFVYLLLKKMNTSISSYREDDKQEGVCGTQATAITSIFVGFFFFFFRRRKTHIWNPMAWFREGGDLYSH